MVRTGPVADFQRKIAGRCCIKSGTVYTLPVTWWENWEQCTLFPKTYSYIVPRRPILCNSLPAGDFGTFDLFVTFLVCLSAQVKKRGTVEQAIPRLHAAHEGHFLFFRTTFYWLA